jgi:ABC-type transporter Mla maintaining outer membrane lipid asymmetry permease subunit MlaE
VLILPRMLALVLALPILAFLGAMAALYGGGLVARLSGGVDPKRFCACAMRSPSIISSSASSRRR